VDELIAKVRQVLSTTPDRWQTLTASVELELLARRPAPGEWSAIECLQHLLDTEVGAFSVRLQAFLDGRDLTAFDPMPTVRARSWPPALPWSPHGSLRLVPAAS
jgi:hypothetical protein